MVEHNEDNFNDLMFDINDHREHIEIASISYDSNRGSSLSNFGIDIDNPEENERYILENQDPQAVIQGIGVEDRIVVFNLEDDSGKATSISKTRDSEFSPVIIDYPKENSLKTQSLLNESEVDTEAANVDINSNETHNEELENFELEETELSPFDLAIEKGYPDQAKIYYDDIFSKGLKLKTKYLTSDEAILGDKEDFAIIDSVTERDFSQIWDGYCRKEFVYQLIFMLEKDFREYLENIEKNQHKKILKRLKYKQTNLNETEKQIERNINTKEKRNNLKLKGETIKIIKKFIVHLEILKKHIKVIEKKNSIPEGKKIKTLEGRVCETREETAENDDFDGATGYSQPSSSKKSIG